MTKKILEYILKLFKSENNWKSASCVPFDTEVLFLLEDKTTLESVIISGKAIKVGEYWDLVSKISYNRSKWDCNKWKLIK